MVGTPRATSANSLVCLHKNTDGAARRPYHETSLLHHEQEQELAVTDLRAFDDERTRFAQLRFGLEQQKRTPLHGSELLRSVFGRK